MGYNGLYWNEQIATEVASARFDIKWQGNKVASRGQNIIVQTPNNEISLMLRCKTSSGAFFFARATELLFQDNKFIFKLKENRLRLIKKKLLDRIEGFDLNDDEDFQLP